MLINFINLTLVGLSGYYNFQIQFDHDIYSVGLGLKKKGENLIKIITVDSMRTKSENLKKKISFFGLFLECLIYYKAPQRKERLLLI